MAAYIPKDRPGAKGEPPLSPTLGQAARQAGVLAKWLSSKGVRVPPAELARLCLEMNGHAGSASAEPFEPSRVDLPGALGAAVSEILERMPELAGVIGQVSFRASGEIGLGADSEALEIVFNPEALDELPQATVTYGVAGMIYAITVSANLPPPTSAGEARARNVAINIKAGALLRPVFGARPSDLPDLSAILGLSLGDEAIREIGVIEFSRRIAPLLKGRDDF